MATIVVDPDTSKSGDLNTEFTVGANWFFNGHRNKLSVDLSRLDGDDTSEGHSQTRVRLQWEISL